MDSKRSRITSGILAVLAATVVACGSVSAGSGGQKLGGANGDIYITADDHYGINPRNASSSGGGAASAPGDAIDGPQLQP